MSESTRTRRDLSQYLQLEEALSPPNSQYSGNSEVSSSPVVPIFEEEVTETINRESFSGSMLTRPIVVVSLIISAFIVGGLWTFRSSSESKKSTPTSSSSSEPLLEDKTQSATPEKVDQVMAENALIKQQQEIQNLAAQKHSQIKQPPLPQHSPVVVSKTQPVRVSVKQAPSSTPGTYVPSTRPQVVLPTTRPPITTVRERPLQKSIPNPNPSQTNKQTIPALRQKEEIDPQLAWLSAAQLGSYGQVPLAELMSDNNQYTGTDFWVQEELDQPVSIRRTEDTRSRRENSQQQIPSPSTTNILDSEELPILRGEPLSIFEIPSGTVAKAVIERAIAWSDSQLEQLNARVTLTEPLTDRDGTIVIPAGSELIVQLVPEEGGLVYLDPQVIEVGEQQIPLEPDSLIIYRSGGRPLVAKRVQEGGRGGINFGSLVFDAARTLAQLTLGGNNSDDGAYQQLYQFERLNQLYNQHLAPENNRRNSTPVTGFWVLEAGMKIEVYVNKTLLIRE